MSDVRIESSMFASRVRTMKADELEKIVGAGAKHTFGRYKTKGGPDNQSKDWI